MSYTFAELNRKLSSDHPIRFAHRMNSEAASVEYFDLFRALPDKYLLLSPSGTVLDLNDAHAASSLPQRRREDVVGLDFFDVWPPNSDTEGEVVRRSHQHVRDTHTPDTMPLLRYDLPLPTAATNLGIGRLRTFRC